MIEFNCGRSDTNMHGTNKPGEQWNRKTVKGWKVRLVTLEGFTGTIPGKRLIVYEPSGAWWWFDAYYVSLFPDTLRPAKRRR